VVVQLNCGIAHTSEAYLRDAQSIEQSRNHLRILGTEMVT